MISLKLRDYAQCGFRSVFSRVDTFHWIQLFVLGILLSSLLLFLFIRYWTFRQVWLNDPIAVPGWTKHWGLAQSAFSWSIWFFWRFTVSNISVNSKLWVSSCKISRLVIPELEEWISMSCLMVHLPSIKLQSWHRPVNLWSSIVVWGLMPIPREGSSRSRKTSFHIPSSRQTCRTLKMTCKNPFNW